MAKKKRSESDALTDTDLETDVLDSSVEEESPVDAPSVVEEPVIPVVQAATLEPAPPPVVQTPKKATAPPPTSVASAPSSPPLPYHLLGKRIRAPGGNGTIKRVLPNGRAVVMLDYYHTCVTVKVR